MKNSIRSVILLSIGLMVVLHKLYAQSDSLSQRDCIFYLKNGNKIRVDRISNINTNRTEIEKEGSLHDVVNEEIQKIKCGGRYFVISNDSLVPFPVVPKTIPAYGKPGALPEDSTWLPDPNIDYAALGRSDANAHFSMLPGVVTGFLTTPTLIVPPFMAAIPPSPSQKHNPNSQLYRKVPEYKEAYRKRAHGKKAAGVLIGVMTFVIVAVALSAN
jgi:hypothetical protein